LEDDLVEEGFLVELTFDSLYDGLDDLAFDNLEVSGDGVDNLVQLLSDELTFGVDLEVLNVDLSLDQVLEDLLQEESLGLLVEDVEVLVDDVLSESVDLGEEDLAGEFLGVQDVLDGVVSGSVHFGVVDLWDDVLVVVVDLWDDVLVVAHAEGVGVVDGGEDALAVGVGVGVVGVDG